MTSTVPQPAPRRLPPLELEVMKSLWEMENATVGQTQAHMRATRLLAYTTVLTLLDRLAKKGAVRREKRGRGYVYSPVLTRDDALVGALDRLVHDFFEDSPARLLDYLENRQPAAAEPSEMRPIDSVLL